MPFHRYTTPAYDLLGGAFPGTIGAQVYDLVNVTSGGVGGGDGSANADAAKVAPHVNAGTYFVAFGEDATSSFANRGMRALSENTDFLDNIVRGSIQRPASTAATLAAASSYTLTGIEAWCGDAVGGSSIESLFEVVDSAGGQVYNSTGTKIYIASVDDGSGGTVVGTGFVTSPRVILNDAHTGSILIRYLTRTSLARIQELPERYRDTRLLMQAATDATYGASFYLHGLNDRYRRGTGVRQDFGSVLADTAGSGGTIRRDGQAVRVWSDWTDNNVAPPAGAYPDPFLANFLADYNRDVGAESDTHLSYDGNIGFLNLYPNRTTWLNDSAQVDAGEPQSRGRFRAGFMSAFPLNVDADTLTNGGTVWTRLKIATPGSTAGSTLTVTSPYYVGDASTGERAIVNGVDLVEVTFDTSGQVRVYIVSAVSTSANTMTLTTLSGEVAVLPTDTCTFTLWQVTYASGGNYGLAHYSPRLVNAATVSTDHIARFGTHGVDTSHTAATFGYFHRQTGYYLWTATITGGGQISCTGLACTAGTTGAGLVSCAEFTCTGSESHSGEVTHSGPQITATTHLTTSALAPASRSAAASRYAVLPGTTAPGNLTLDFAGAGDGDEIEVLCHKYSTITDFRVYAKEDTSTRYTTLGSTIGQYCLKLVWSSTDNAWIHYITS